MVQETHGSSGQCASLFLINEGVLCGLAADSRRCTQCASTAGLQTGQANHGTCGPTWLSLFLPSAAKYKSLWNVFYSLLGSACKIHMWAQEAKELMHAVGESLTYFTWSTCPSIIEHMICTTHSSPISLIARTEALWPLFLCRSWSVIIAF